MEFFSIDDRFYDPISSDWTNGFDVAEAWGATEEAPQENKGSAGLNVFHPFVYIGDTPGVVREMNKVMESRRRRRYWSFDQGDLLAELGSGK